MSRRRLVDGVFEVLFWGLVVLAALPAVPVAMMVLDGMAAVPRLQGDAIGLTEQDIIARFGERRMTIGPDDVFRLISPPNVPSDRPISGKLLLYSFSSGGSITHYDNHFIYLSEAGTVECALIRPSPS